MKYPCIARLAIILAAAPLFAEKLTDEDRVEILRGMMAEYATVKVALPRSRKPLPFESKGNWDKKVWADAQRENGPAARVGDMVQVSKVSFDDDRLVLEINGGAKDKKKWYERIEVGMGGSGRTTPIGGQGTMAPGGTVIALIFEDKKFPLIKAADIKKLLAPILDFEKRSATENYIETLPEPVKKAIAEKKVIEGMDREQVLLAVGQPRRKTRENKDGVELEDWIYGEPPGKITFVTFTGSKVSKVKDSYAGLGGSTAAPVH